MTQKILGVLTSGGDCAGLNTILKAVTERAIGTYGWRVLGISNGIQGLLTDPPHYQELECNFFDLGLARQGGTILGTSRISDPFRFPMEAGVYADRSQEILQTCKKIGLDGIIGIGGDGSMQLLKRLFEKGDIPFIGIPKTIDNDIGATESSIGFSTAVDVATEALDRLQPTAASHDRVMILEVMGRDAGHIALTAGIAGGADIIIIPEIPYAFEHIVHKIQSIFKSGRNYALVIVAEAVKTETGEAFQIVDPITKRARYGGIGHYLSDKITELTNAECRFTVLGHVLRGAQPNATDRVLAYAFGVKAVDLMAEGQYSQMVAWQNRQVVAVPLQEAVKTYRAVDVTDTLVQTARSLGVCFGDQPAIGASQSTHNAHGR